jgi:hypothetical protein
LLNCGYLFDVSVSALTGWTTTSRQREDGAIDSEQRIPAHRPVVESSERGAAELSSVYWREVERFMHGLVRAQVGPDGQVELRLRPSGRVLLAFGQRETRTANGITRCTHAITGGLLARRPGGSISFSQETAPPALASAISGFLPRFAAAPGRPSWTGALYEQLQRRLHLAVSKRYFAALLREKPP